LLHQTALKRFIGGPAVAVRKRRERGGALVYLFAGGNLGKGVPMTELEVGRGGAVLLPLHPVKRLTGLKPGQTWRTVVLDPIPDSLIAIQGLTNEARKVTAKVRPVVERIDWAQRTDVACLVIDYEGDRIAVSTWVRRDDGAFDLRWFTPTVEVDLCGHATLASAHVLWSEGRLPRAEKARFHTKSGVLTAWREADTIRMYFPSEPVAAAAPPETLTAALGTTISFAGRNRMDWLVELADQPAVLDVRPQLPALASLDMRGVIVTARSESSERDFVSRFFAPGAGVDEDPVTGSAHCALAPYWAAKLGKTALTGYQASARGGIVLCTVAGDRVVLGGRAVTVFRATLL
jgi:predicted PhzF superfamily epimerase YddE/YHI9